MTNQTRLRWGARPILSTSAALTVSSIGNPLISTMSPLAQVVASVLMLLLYSASVVVLIIVLNRLTDYLCGIVAVVMASILAVGFAVVYPLQGAPQEVGQGSDQDDAINILVSHLPDPGSPYTESTYLGNAISNLMGSALLGAPFEFFFGTAAWLNPVVVMAAAIILWRVAGGRLAAFATVATSLSLGFLATFLVGGDYIVSGIVFCLAAYWMRFARPIGPSEFAAATLLAVAGATRIHLLPVVALVVLIVVVHKGCRSIPAAVFAGVVSMAIVAYWYIPDPRHFTPLATTNIAGGKWPTIVVGLIIVALAGLTVARRCDLPDLIVIGLGIALVEATFVPSQMYRGITFVFFATPLLVLGGPSLGCRSRRVPAAH